MTMQGQLIPKIANQTSPGEAKDKKFKLKKSPPTSQLCSTSIGSQISTKLPQSYSFVNKISLESCSNDLNRLVTCLCISASLGFLPRRVSSQPYAWLPNTLCRHPNRQLQAWEKAELCLYPQTFVLSLTMAMIDHHLLGSLETLPSWHLPIIIATQ